VTHHTRSTWLALAALLLLGAPLKATGPSGPPSSSHLKLERAAQRAGLRAQVLRLALGAHARAVRQGWTAAPVLTVIDYSRRSRERRLWVLDLSRDSVLATELVAHGRGTGDDVARWFSNRPGSLASSLGTFITGPTYRGRHGLALRLRGMDRGLNDRAEARAIVIHGAAYVGPDAVRRLGRLGRSQGCPALAPSVADRVIGLIRGGTVLYAYYPDPDLLRRTAPLSASR
jgi:L,D-transpeptidase-like protein